MSSFDAARIKLILINLKGPFENCSDSIDIFPSPDNRHAVVFSHGWEMTMMNWSYLFTLLDKDLRVVEKFDRLTSIRPACAWSADSAITAVPGAAWNGLLLWNVSRSTVAVARTSSRQFVFDFTGPSTLRIQFDPQQLQAMNSQAVFGGGKAECPVQKFKAPEDARVDASALKWHARDDLSKIAQLSEESPVIDMTAVADGFFPFSGKFPSSTTDVFNGRQLEVFQLEAFSAYGDKQAQAWLAEIQKSVDASRWAQARWSPVSKYLGSKKRTLPPDVSK